MRASRHCGAMGALGLARFMSFFDATTVSRLVQREAGAIPRKWPVGAWQRLPSWGHDRWRVACEGQPQIAERERRVVGGLACVVW